MLLLSLLGGASGDPSSLEKQVSVSRLPLALTEARVLGRTGIPQGPLSCCLLIPRAPRLGWRRAHRSLSQRRPLQTEELAFPQLCAYGQSFPALVKEEGEPVWSPVCQASTVRGASHLTPPLILTVTLEKELVCVSIPQASKLRPSSHVRCYDYER